MDPKLEIARLAEKLESYIDEFLKKADPKTSVFFIWKEYASLLTDEAIVDFALYLMPRLDAYTNLMMAHWASSYSNKAIETYMGIHAAETKEEIDRRCALLNIDYSKDQPAVEKWFAEFKKNTALHATTSVPFLAQVKTLLADYLPSQGRSQAEIDAALSAVGLPTSTESVESWLKRLTEKRH